jgi:hypothetical protein
MTVEILGTIIGVYGLLMVVFSVNLILTLAGLKS